MKRADLESRAEKIQLEKAAKDLRRDLDSAFKREIDAYRVKPPKRAILEEKLQRAIVLHVNIYFEKIGLPSRISYEIIKAGKSMLDKGLVENIETGITPEILNRNIKRLDEAKEALKKGKIKPGEFLSEQEVGQEAYKVLFYSPLLRFKTFAFRRIRLQS